MRSHSPPIIQRQQFLVVNFTKNLKYYKFPLYFRIYLLLLQLHLLAEAPQGVSGRVQSLWKRAFTKRLSLTTRKLRNFTKIVKGQDNGECPRVVYYYYSWFVISIYGIPRKCSIYLLRGLLRCPSPTIRAMRRPASSGDGQRARFPRFLFV